MNSRYLTYVGLLTWALVAFVHVQWVFGESPAMTAANIAFLACLFAFGAAFLIRSRAWCTGRVAVLLTGLQSVLAIGCLAFGPSGGGFLPILLVIVAGQMGEVELRQALLWIAGQTIVLAQFLPDRQAIPMALAYFTFQLFGVFAVRMAHEESEAKQALAAANAELRVATGLLDISSRAEERLRIARELHDLLGHHLTALSLNLEVASHLAQGEAREQILKSQELTKLLLSDVRDSVSRLREDEPVDLAAALHSVREAVPSPAIHIDAAGVGPTDPALARTALRAVQEIVTNAVRHSSGNNLWLTLAQRDDSLSLDARDDGTGTDQVQFGNGLRGMRERVLQCGGTMDVASMRGRGFEVHIRLPLPGGAA